MQHPAVNGQQPLFCEQVIELIEGGRVGSSLAVDEIDPRMKCAALNGEKPFLLEQREELPPIRLRDAMKLVIGYRWSLCRLGICRDAVHENGRKEIAAEIVVDQVDFLDLGPSTSGTSRVGQLRERKPARHDLGIKRHGWCIGTTPPAVERTLACCSPSMGALERGGLRGSLQKSPAAV